MKQTLTTSQAADILRADENANWTYAGALALVEYLEEYEESTGEELELDVVAIRCDYAQYDNLTAFAFEYGDDQLSADIADMDDDDRDDAIRRYIEENGTLIEFDGGVIVSSF